MSTTANATASSVLRVLPRHMIALNALAESHGLGVEVLIEPYDGKTADNIFAKWTGTKEQLFAVGLFTPTQQRLPIARGSIIVPSTIHWERHPLVRGHVTVQDDQIVYEVDFGPVPREIVQRGLVEIAVYENYSSYHGTAEALIDACVCARSQLPLGAKRGNRDHPHGLKYEGAEWYTRRQPDGTFLHWLETEAAREKRMAEWNEQMGACRVRTRTAISRLAEVYESRTADMTEKPRANHLRLVVSNGPRKEPQP